MLQELLKKEISQFHTSSGLANRYIKKKQLCHYLNLSNNTVDKLISKGLPRINVQGVILYDKEQVDKWLTHYYQSS